MKKKLFLIPLLTFMSLTACGGGSSPVKPTEPTTPSVPSEPSEPSVPTEPSEPSEPTSGKPDKVTINFWHTFGQTILDNLQPQLERFAKIIKAQEGVEVTINLVPNSNYQSIHTAIDKALSAGSKDIPTIAVAYPDHVADYIYAENGVEGKYVVNFDDLINNAEYGLGKNSYLGDAEGDSLDDFFDAYIEEGRSFSREGLFTFPYMKSTEVMLYNYTAVEKLMEGYKPEFHGSKDMIHEYMSNLNWDEFMNLCRYTWENKKIVNPDLKYPAFYDSDGNLFVSQMHQLGIPYSSIVDNGKGGKVGHIDFASGPELEYAMDMVSNLRDYYNEHLFTTKGAFSTYGSDSFKNVESVFTIGSSGGAGYSLTTDFEIGVCKVPYLNNNPLYVNQGVDLMIMNNPALSDTANKYRTEYAWKLIKFLTNAENNARICLKGSEGYTPVRKSAYEDDLYLDFLDSGEFQAEIYSLIQSEIDGLYFNTACFPGSAKLREEVGGIITYALTESTSLDSIFQTAISNATMALK